MQNESSLCTQIGRDRPGDVPQISRVNVPRDLGQGSAKGKQDEKGTLEVDNEQTGAALTGQYVELEALVENGIALDCHEEDNVIEDM